ncbi:MAG: hypothetical protein GXO77_00750 [Calditrichaeota bacterium]|nr:hypothetical protein [Calditrichota bacterium]
MTSEDGSEDEDLWGANLIKDEKKYLTEYTAFINIRPAQSNRSMEIENPETRERIETIIKNLIL